MEAGEHVAVIVRHHDRLEPSGVHPLPTDDARDLEPRSFHLGDARELGPGVDRLDRLVEGIERLLPKAPNLLE